MVLRGRSSPANLQGERVPGRKPSAAKQHQNVELIVDEPAKVLEHQPALDEQPAAQHKIIVNPKAKVGRLSVSETD